METRVDAERRPGARSDAGDGAAGAGAAARGDGAAAWMGALGDMRTEIDGAFANSGARTDEILEDQQRDIENESALEIQLCFERLKLRRAAKLELVARRRNRAALTIQLA